MATPDGTRRDLMQVITQGSYHLIYSFKVHDLPNSGTVMAR